MLKIRNARSRAVRIFLCFKVGKFRGNDIKQYFKFRGNDIKQRFEFGGNDIKWRFKFAGNEKMIYICSAKNAVNYGE